MKAEIGKYWEIVSGSKYVLLINVTDKLFSFAVMLMLARKLPADNYGIIVTLFTLTIILAAVFDLGLPLFLQREISLNPSTAPDMFSKAFLTGIILFVFYFALGSLVLFVLYPDIPFSLYVIISLMIYGSSLVNICNKALSALNDFKSQFLSFLIPRILITSLFVIGLFYYLFSVKILMVIMLAGFSLNLLLVYLSLSKHKIKFTLSGYSLKHMQAMLSLSIPLGLAVVFNLLYDKVDVILLSLLTDFSEVAYYNIGYGIFKAATLSFSFLLVPGFTKVASLNRNKDGISSFFRQYAVIISLICAMISAILFLFPDFIIDTLYTSRFYKSAAVLRILSVGIIAVGMNNLTGIILNGMGYFKIVMYITLYALAMNTGLNILFIPGFGIIAASYITLLTEFFILIMEYYYYRKIMKN
ncbi:MAG: oligosaccharide flippase family protein [Ignavibacteria bacterium]|nr:oligosaccharide flippase family protein [Ignavibacteria bacterium]